MKSFVFSLALSALLFGTVAHGQTPPPAAPPTTPTPAQSPTGQPQTPPATPPADPTTSPPQEPAGHDHDHMNMNMDMDMGTSRGWHFMQDGIVFGLFNHQGGARGGHAEVKAPNWWMGMWGRPIGHQHLTFTTMVSLDPVTVGRKGYAELFQSGESLDGRPVVDRQHPHDFFMQLAGVWRAPLGGTTGLTIAGGPAGEPALGPVAFMHRASAAENPTAPLGHHTFDSTHISYGVVTAAVDHGPWTVEGSLFNGREPDEHRWNLDLGPLDSVSSRVWFRPNAEWEFQASSGFLNNPEALDPVDVVRTTISGSWLRRQDADFTAVTAGVGVNRTNADHHGSFFTEATRRTGLNTVYGRFEAHEPEMSLLLTGQLPATPQPIDRHGTLLALTIGGVRDVGRGRGLELGLGGDLSVYRVPDVLRTGGYGRPVSFRLFLRLRPAGSGRMWNARMAHPM
jgi:hypothetical protein